MPSTISVKKRWEIVFLSTHRLGPKLPHSKVASYVHCSVDTVKFWLQRYKDTSEVDELPHTGRPASLSSKTDTMMQKLLDKDPEASSATITTHLKRKGVVVSDRTVRRRLHATGLTYGAMLPKPLLKTEHCKKRLLWAKANVGRDWEKVIFTDEASINVNIKRRKVWHKPGQKLVIRTVKHPVKIHIWGCVSSKGFGHCYTFTHNLNAKYLLKIYNTALLSSIKKFGGSKSSWVVQEDNDPKHKSKLAAKWREENNITRLDWPAQSPDQNCIENAWHVLKIRVSNRKPRNLKQLNRVVKQEWKKLSKSYAKKLVGSMSKRVQALIEAGGDYTMY